MYYNTTNLEGSDLKQAISKARTQEEKILRYYSLYPSARMSPDFIWDKLFKREVPITSVRRGITNLTKAGKLLKTDSTSIGFYGKKVYRWTLNRK